MYVFMYVCLCKSPSAVLFTLQLLKHSSNRLRITMIRCKRLKVEGDKHKLDRLTDLPINVKHQIQEHLSIEDAAKMSVLSRPWRHVWASIPKLEFSAQFCRSKPPDTLVDVINTILSQHVGAIKTFLLNISSIPSSQHHVIDQWMLLLSRNGVVDLTLQNLHSAPYKLPSYMYSVELESLNLSNCIFRPPCNFRGFCKLKMLTLLEVALEFDVSTSCLWMMPNLFSLKVRLCGGLPKIYAPELLHIFFFTRSPKTLMLDNLMDCRKLKTVILAKPEKNQDKPMNLTYLLNCWPMIKRLSLDGYYLKSFAYGTEEERLPTCLNRLKALSLFNFNFNDEDRLFSLLRLFGSSPNLEDLLLLLTWNKKGGMEVNVNHFERPAYRTLGLNKLQKFKIENFRGSRTKMLFVRFILASAPLLQEAILLEDAERVHESQSSEILKEVRGFPQASPKLKIVCKPSKMAKEVVY